MAMPFRSLGLPTGKGSLYSRGKIEIFRQRNGVIRTLKVICCTLTAQNFAVCSEECVTMLSAELH